MNPPSQPAAAADTKLPAPTRQIPTPAKPVRAVGVPDRRIAR